MRYFSTFLYILFIILINNLFTYAPVLTLLGSPYSSADIMVGVIYILRDFSQRELGHKVFYAMLIGCLLSYWLANQSVATASVVSFFVGELIDWFIFTYTKKPLSQRLLSSSFICAPIDSAVFLYMINQLNWVGVGVLTLGKALGIISVWLIWRSSVRTKPTAALKASQSFVR